MSPLLFEAGRTDGRSRAPCKGGSWSLRQAASGRPRTTHRVQPTGRKRADGAWCVRKDARLGAYHRCCDEPVRRSRQLMTFDVAIVGGGFAGVTAARDLAAAGRSVMILEARDRLGGRTWYRPFAGTEHGVELGGTWFSLARQPPLAEEVERYGVRVVPAATRLCARWHTGGVTRHGLPVPQSEGAALERVLRSLSLASQDIDLTRDDVSVPDWLGEDLPDATRDFLFAWASFMSGADPAEVSMVEFLGIFAANGGDVWSLYDEISECFADGTGALLDALTADADADVRLSTPVTRIEERNDEVVAHHAVGRGDSCRRRRRLGARKHTRHDRVRSAAPSGPGSDGKREARGALSEGLGTRGGSSGRAPGAWFRHSAPVAVGRIRRSRRDARRRLRTRDRRARSR